MKFQAVKDFFIRKLETELPCSLYYHGIAHTLDVMNATEYYAKMEKVKAEDITLLKTAALFHDCGFLIKYLNNETESVHILKEVLPGFGYNAQQIDKIGRMILSTKIPQQPKNLLEKILCDADLDYLGREDFYIISITLMREWNENGIITSLKEWYIQEVYFMQQHEYFTNSAIGLRKSKKMHHLEQIMELLGKNI